MIRDRVIERRQMKASDVAPNPRNWREHPEHQQAALAEVLMEVGQVGELYAWHSQRDGGKLTLIDGHLRTELDPDQEWTVAITDLTDAEADRILLTRDPIAALATTNAEAIEALAASMLNPDGPLAAMIAEVQAAALEASRSANVSKPKLTAVASLKPHPKNYREHPDDQLAHIIASIERNGIYRNVVTANDGTVLVGHGLVKALIKMGIEWAPAIRLECGPNDPAAMALMVGDNEAGKLADVNDRTLTDTLRGLTDEQLSGTGFNREQLAALVAVTRPAAELQTMDAAAEWVGMPPMEAEEKGPQLSVRFTNDADRLEFMQLIGADVVQQKRSNIWTIHWPEVPKNEWTAVKFE